MIKPLLILGAGGHASVLFDILLQQNRTILGIVSPSIESKCLEHTSIPHLVSDNDIFSFSPTEVKLVNGIGSLPKSSLRAKLYKKFSEYGYEFETVISNSSIVSNFSKLSEGVQVLHGAIIQAGSVVGENTIVNTGAQIDHDCHIGSNNHLAPGVVLSGNVHTGESVHLGTNSGVIQNIKIGYNTLIGAGAIVTADVPPNTICYTPKNSFKETSKDE